MGDMMQAFEEKKAAFESWMKEQPAAVRALAARRGPRRSRARHP